MMPCRTILAAAGLSVLASAATAAPVVTDPNFNQTATSSLYYYGLTAWGATNLPFSPTYAGNQSFAGNVGFDTANQWDNGTPGNGQTKVGFIGNSTAQPNGYILQAISGFTVGDSYVITVLANGRVVAPQTSAGLTISVAPPPPPTAIPFAAALTPSATVYSGAIAPVAPVGNQTTLFQTVTSNAFVATATTEVVTLTNTGTMGSTVNLSGFALADVTGPAVPEPVSMALLGTGLLGLAALRRRR